MNVNAALYKATKIQQEKLAESQHRFDSWDGARLFYRAWRSDSPADRAVILFHGGHEHSGRFQDLVSRLDLDDMPVFAWDARGHGHSPGLRGYARHFHDYVRDADAFIRHISASYDIPTSKMVLVGHSVGSVVAATWMYDYARPIRGAVLGSPAFYVKLYIPFALPVLKLWQRFRPDSFVNSYVRPGFLTHDQEEVQARSNDALISPRIAVRVLTSLFDTADRVIRGAGSITTPILILSAGSDWVVRRDAHEAFFNQLGSTQKVLQFYPGFFHEVFHEKNRQVAITQVKQFIENLFQPKFTTPISEKEMPLNDEAYKSLTRPLSLLSSGKLVYGIIKAALWTVGRLSKGIRLGWRVGFDSGRSLDYVYANRPQGFTLFGRLIDRVYLNSVGWRRTRDRLRHLEAQLTAVIKRLRDKGQPVHIVDLAAGPGRCVLQTMRSMDDTEVTATCRDLEPSELVKGVSIAYSLGVTNVQFEPGDALNPASIEQLDPRPDIVIVSGLYELFPDNDKIRRSLCSVRHVLNDGGFLIYTNQPYHPQLDLIARTLVNRKMKPWVMRIRPQAEMNCLVRQSGFEPENMLIDDDGIFSVTVARKRAT